MLQTIISKLSGIFNNYPGMKKLLITYGLVLTGLSALFLFNRFVLVNQVQKDDWIILTELSNLFVLEGKSPYDINFSEIANRSTLIIDSVDAQNGQFSFKSPVYILFLFFPFSLISDQLLSLSIWLTINQTLIILAINMFMELLGLNVNQKVLFFIISILFLAHFSIVNLLYASISIFQLFFMVVSLKAFYQEDEILTGISLALMLVSPSLVVLPIIIILSMIIRNKKYSIISWFGIAVMLLSLAGIIIDSNWPLKMIRNIYDQNNIPFFYSFEPILDLIPMGIRNPNIRYLFPVILVGWLFKEWHNIELEHSNQLLWGISLAICINSLIFFQYINNLSVFYAIVFLFIIHIWNKRVRAFSLLIFIGLITFPVVLLPMYITRFFTTIDNKFLTSFQFLTAIFLIIMLYWVKWWVYDDTYLLSV